MNKGFIWAMIGGVIGILLGILLLAAIGIASDYGFAVPVDAVLYGVLVLVFSIVGIICGLLNNMKIVAGIIMIVSGVVILVLLQICGSLTFIPFLIGGIMILREAKT